MTRATISIKRKNDIYDQLWYVNSDGHPTTLGKNIYQYLKTVDDVERAVVIFRQCSAYLETAFTIGETDSIQDILDQHNDYSYILDEKTGKWGYYSYSSNILHDLEKALSK